MSSGLGVLSLWGEKAFGYFVLIGNRRKAIRKKRQYKTPDSWSTGSGPVWGYSRTIKTVQFEITNVKQRRCIDSYLRAHLGIPSKVSDRPTTTRVRCLNRMTSLRS